MTDDRLDACELDPDERALVDAIAARRDDIVDLACTLVGFDTQARAGIGVPPRQEAALQQHLAERLRGAGAEVDVWEPAPEDVAGHPVSVEGIGFEGRPQLVARLRGAGGGRTLLLNGHIDVVTARREDGWEHDPFDPQVRDGVISGRGTCDMKGGIAAMVVAAEALAATGALRGDVLVCTNTDEESSGVGGLACARRGLGADFAIVPEPTGLEVWPACRGSVYCEVSVPGRAGHAEQEHAHFAEGGAVNAIEKARHLLDGVERLRLDWRSRHELRHDLLSPPDVLCTRFEADGGWYVTIPNRADLVLAVLILPVQADAGGWTGDVQRGGRGLPAALVRRRPVAARAPADVHVAHRGQPLGDAARRRQRARPARRERGARPAGPAGRAGLLVRRRDLRAGGRLAGADVRPAPHRLGAHRGRVRADRRPRRLRAGDRGRRLATLPLT